MPTGDAEEVTDIPPWPSNRSSASSSVQASLPVGALAARLVSKFSTGFTLDEEERALFAQTLGESERLGCFAAFLNSMEARHFLEVRASFLAKADEHLSCGLAAGFVRAQAEDWLLATHGSAPAAGREMTLCAYGLPMQLLVSAAHEVIHMQRGGNAASHLDYDLPAVRLVLLHVFVEAAWRVWRAWALSVLRTLPRPSAAVTPRSARGAADQTSAAPHSVRLPRGGGEGGGDGVEPPSADEFEEMHRKLLKWHQSQRKSIQLGGRAALRHVVTKVKYWGFANAAEFYAFCDQHARQCVSQTDLRRALSELRVEHVDVRSILQLSPRVQSRNGMEHEVQLSDVDFVRLFSWNSFYHSDSTGVYLGELPAFAALAHARRIRDQVTKRTLARVAAEEPHAKTEQSSGPLLAQPAQHLARSLALSRAPRAGLPTCLRRHAHFRHTRPFEHGQGLGFRV